MKRQIIALLLTTMMVVGAYGVLAVKPDSDCTTIQDGTLLTSGGDVITTGFDEWGYNYQAHLFEGYYCDSYRDAPWCQEWSDVKLSMKWNDAWLSNKDCDNDGKLDRHFGHDSYIGSGAWLTNHQSGTYSVPVERLNIGVAGDIEALSLIGWSDTWTWGGGYGGGDDGTLRLLLGPGDGCCGHEDAYFTINTNGAKMDTITLNHLDGSQNDNYKLFMLTGYNEDTTPIWTQIGDEYLSEGGGEHWVQTTYNFDPVCGEIEFKLLATGTVTQWCQSWGQVAFSWVEWSEVAYWNYFVKIVAAPADAYVDADIWYTADGVEIGPVIWGAFAVIQEVENDHHAGIHGLQYNAPAPTGFGYY